MQIICEPETRGEGYRHGWLGNSGSGKTTAIRRLITSKGGDVLHLVHDDSKREAQYPGAVVASFDAAPDDASIVTLRGDPYAGTVVETEDVCALALSLALSRIPVRVVIDELDRACTPGGKELAGQAVRDCLTKGRAMELSFLWSTQAPQRAPREVIDQSTTIALCQLGPRALNYLDDRLLFDPELLSVVPTLQVGEFVIYQQGRDWNRTIYRCPGDA